MRRHEARAASSLQQRRGTQYDLHNVGSLSLDSVWKVRHGQASNANSVHACLQVLQAASVLNQLNPLKHVAPFRKSQMQHALADMLASILELLVESGNPRWVWRPTCG